MTTAVAITGVGAVTPLGVGARALLERWATGVCAIEDGAGRCTEFDTAGLLDAREARRAARFAQLGVVAADEALADAGWSGGLPYAAERIGCVLGSGIGGLGVVEEQVAVLAERGRRRVSPLTIPLMMANAGAGALAIRYGLGGQVYATVSACAAGTHAIGAAARMISAGDADAVVAGGAEAALTPLALSAFAAMGALSPSGASRPFDARRDGFVMGEGAGVLVLERPDAAAARGARVLGYVLGYGATNDAYHMTAPDPDGTGAARAIELALRDAGVAPDEVDYVNAHGTATAMNDRVETLALKRALGARAADVPVSSTKSAIGHLLGAAGAVEAVATVLALRERLAPPTLGLEQPDDGLDLDYVPLSARTLRIGHDGPPIALSNSFGFGGHNAVLCLSGAC